MRADVDVLPDVHARVAPQVAGVRHPRLVESLVATGGARRQTVVLAGGILEARIGNHAEMDPYRDRRVSFSSDQEHRSPHLPSTKNSARLGGLGCGRSAGARRGG